MTTLTLIDFLTHSENRIAAPVGEVWPFVLDTNGWYTQQTVSVGGSAGEIGERFHVVPRNDPAQVLFHMETVELVQRQRRTVRLDAADGTFLGYATWVLRERDGHTEVGYHVYCRVPVPEGSAAQEIVAAAQRATDEGLERLKALVEGGA